jgi:zinc D-Ala-D-Ala carboxypeptidase
MVGGNSGWVSAQYLDIGDFRPAKQSSPARKTATVLEDLNLRAGPSTSDDILDVMPAGTTVTISGGEQGGFLPVSVEGQSGWSYALYLSASGKPLADPTATVLEDLNLRDGPSANDSILDVIPAGAKVTLTGNGRNGFVSVSYGGTDGWAYGAYVD